MVPTRVLLAATLDALTRHTAPTRDAAVVHEHTLAHLRTHGTVGFSRQIPEHVTASALVLDPSLTRTLLCFHRKGGFWVQPGGHLDADDATPAAGALREMREETGAQPVAGVDPGLRTQLADIDRHHLSASFGTCRTHIDLGFLVIADPGAPLAVSAESLDVAWWPLDALPDDAAEGLGGRLAVAAVVAVTATAAR